MTSPINTLDYRGWTTHPVTDFVTSMGQSLRDTGFFLLGNHGISSTLLAENRRLFAIFFKQLTLEQRMKYSFPGKFYQQGYTPPNLETGEHSKVPDRKHFWQFGDDNPMLAIEEVPGLKEVSEELYAQFGGLYKELMRATALGLGLDGDYFDAKLGNSIIRHIHYPGHDTPVTTDAAVEDEVVQGGNIGGMCAARHTDINDLTLLHATEPGLELLHHGTWVPVLCNFETIIVNTGDMLWHLTGGRYQSGQHRVVCEPGKERFSSPYFGHCRDDVSIVPLPHLGESDLAKFRFKTEGEFLRYRLEQIGLKAKS